MPSVALHVEKLAQFIKWGLTMSTEELRVKPLSVSESLAVIRGLGRAVTVQNQEEAMWKGQDRTRLRQTQRLREEG